jgi:hypothetical protein
MEKTGNQPSKANKNPGENDPDNSTHYEKYEGGAQGNDKAPGEDSAKGNEDLMKQSQKGKKVDADPSLSSDQPAS